MKAIFLSAFYFFCTSATTFSQQPDKEINTKASLNAGKSDLPITGLHGKKATNNPASINVNGEVINLEKTYQASYYAALVNGEFNFVLVPLQKPSSSVKKF